MYVASSQGCSGGCTKKNMLTSVTMAAINNAPPAPFFVRPSPACHLYCSPSALFRRVFFPPLCCCSPATFYYTTPTSAVLLLCKGNVRVAVLPPLRRSVCYEQCGQRQQFRVTGIDMVEEVEAIKIEEHNSIAGG